MKQLNTFLTNKCFNNLFNNKCVEASQTILATHTRIVLPAGFLSEPSAKNVFLFIFGFVNVLVLSIGKIGLVFDLAK